MPAKKQAKKKAKVQVKAKPKAKPAPVKTVEESKAPAKVSESKVRPMFIPACKP